MDSNQANLASKSNFTTCLFDVPCDLENTCIRTHVDVADVCNVASKSSAINMPCMSGMVNVVELFGVPLKTLEDINDLTKGIELGKYEVLSGMTSYKRKEVMDTLFAMWDVVNPISSKPKSYANAASGASMEVLIGLVDKIESGALDDVISGLTTAEHQAAHALVLELARGFDYVNSDSDTSSEEPIRDTPGMVSHIDDIVKSVSIQYKPSSYVGTAEGRHQNQGELSFPIFRKSMRRCRYFYTKKVVFANTFYGYFIGKRIALSVVKYYV
ncbi:hypothetical protein Tco_0475682 [Tanacetum coccineum]